jgi:hypothetical protein
MHCSFLKKRKNLAHSYFGQKRSIFSHTSPFFSSDALHRTQKSGSSDQKLPTFLTRNRWAKFLQKNVKEVEADR